MLNDYVLYQCLALDWLYPAIFTFHASSSKMPVFYMHTFLIHTRDTCEFEELDQIHVKAKVAPEFLCLSY